jgi:hypothetical protein
MVDTRWLPQPPQVVQCPEQTDEPGKLCHFFEANTILGCYEYRCEHHVLTELHLIAPEEAERLQSIAEAHGQEECAPISQVSDLTPIWTLRDQLLDMKHDLDEHFKRCAEHYASRKGKGRRYAQRTYREMLTVDSARANVTAAARYLSWMVDDD